MNQPPQAAMDVFKRLDIEHLRGHANATPERMAWIERAAPGKNSPGGWAAKCIREGYPVPPPTKADATEAKKAARKAWLARFDAMPGAEREAIMAQVRAEYPNLSNLPDYDPVVRGAVAKVLATREGPDARAGGEA